MSNGVNGPSTTSVSSEGCNLMVIEFWNLVVETVSQHHDGLKKAHISLGGGITLIQTYLPKCPICSHFISMKDSFKVRRSREIAYDLGRGSEEGSP